MEFIKKNISNIFAIIFFLGFLFFTIKQSLKYKERYYTGIPTVGEITKIGVKNLYWDYSVKGIIYDGIISLNSYRFLYPGERYFVYCDKSDYAESSICLTSPYIDKSLFDSTYSNRIDIHFEKGTELITFCYFYKNKLYKRSHLVHLQHNVTLFKKRFLVYVNRNKPYIAYIKLQKQKKDSSVFY
jgi:hypothetical protein